MPSQSAAEPVRFAGRLKRAVKRLMTLGALPLAHLVATVVERTGDSEPVFDALRRHGFYFLREHFYLPIPDDDDMKRASRSDLVGVAMNDEAQLRFTNEVVGQYRPEFRRFPERPTGDDSRFHLINGAFMAGDGHVYYALIRHLKPRVIIEIGSGNSTVLANHAIEKNLEESADAGTRLIAIEPYPPDRLSALSQLSELKTCKLQDVGPDYFDQLGAGDILFIDSSHVLKSGGDVWLEYCEIIPRLHPGVYVHVHDISLPKPYPAVYYDAHLYWNEQYALQALLTNNDRLEVVWAGTYLFDKYPDEMQQAFSPEYERMRETYPQAEPSSFWFRVR